ncbi:sensor histidine kinase [Roseomonas sp. USHLN139]|uniref:sensor histidine kinase n=1 Tax=Roseomonas sp. USHLN139 TaxID=3081298 RepID=UPI003B01F081
MQSRSLHARIMVLLALVFGAVSGGFAIAAWVTARVVADGAHDALLAAGAAQIAENMYVAGGVLVVEPPIAVVASLSAQDRVVYKVVDARGIVVAGSSGLDSPPADGTHTQLGRTRLMGQDYHTATTARRIQGGWASVTLAQTNHAREEMARGLAAKSMVLILALSGLGLVATLLAVRLALAPLRRVEAAIAARDPQDLAPLVLDAPPEIHTLLAAINAFMARLEAHLGQMRRLIGDAAHQIRTPLTALTAQLEMLEGAQDEAARQAHLARLQDRAAQLGRLAAQLFDHAMVLHRAGQVRLEEVDLVPLARQVLVALLPLAGRIRLELEAPEVPVLVAGDRVSLREALSNLVHNALKHGARTHVLVTLRQDTAMTLVEISDDGPGIPPSRWQHVREPFHSRGEAERGAGLGVAIAEQVMRAHGGALSFRLDSSEGFSVILLFAGRAPVAARVPVADA